MAYDLFCYIFCLGHPLQEIGQPLQKIDQPLQKIGQPLQKRSADNDKLVEALRRFLEENRGKGDDIDDSKEDSGKSDESKESGSGSK